MKSYAVTVVVAGLALGLAAMAEEKKNLLPNGSFEKIEGGVPVSWVFGADEGQQADFRITQQNPKDGRNSLRITGNVTWAAAISTQRIRIEPGKRYTLTGHARAPRGQATIKFDYFENEEHLGQTLDFNQIVQATDDWTRVSVRSETALYPTATHLVATVAILGDSDAYFDDLKVTAE